MPSPKLCVAVALFCAAASAFAQSAADRIRSVADSSDYDQITARPWHLQLNVTLYDSQGKNPQQGTIDVWRNGADVKTTYSFAGKESTDVVVGGKHSYAEAATVPEYAETLLRHFLHPGPTTEDFADATAEERSQSFGKEKFDCIMMSHPFVDHETAPLGVFPTYCLIHGTDHLGATYDFGGRIVILRAMGTFLGHTVATSMEVMENNHLIATGTVAKLATFTPTDADFSVPDEKPAPLHDPRIPGGVIQGMRTSYVPPVYPQSAKSRHAQGTVVLHAIIGRDGRIHELRPITYPDPDLLISSILAVRQWTYKPYLLNGEATSIDTTITVNFNLGPA